MRDFVPVAMLFRSELVMVVHPSVPANNVKEFIALAKSKPGELTTPRPARLEYPWGELFKNLTGTNLVHVPYRGSAGARNDILGGSPDDVRTRCQMGSWSRPAR